MKHKTWEAILIRSTSLNALPTLLPRHTQSSTAGGIPEGALRIIIGALRIEIETLRIIIGPLRIIIGALRIIIETLRIIIGPLRIIIGALRIIVTHLKNYCHTLNAQRFPYKP